MNRVKELIGSVQGVESRYLGNVCDLVNSLDEWSRERQRIHREYAVSQDFGFNFFTSISDFHRRETFHSDVLALILDPNTDVIGTEAATCLDCFFRAIERASDGRLQITLGTRTETRVLKEVGNLATGRIDLLIHDGTHAVIVENKINDAIDQPDQLARYLRYCQMRPEGALQVEAIVYLPRTWKEPPHDYSEACSDLVDKVKALTVVLPAVGRRATESTSAQIDLAHDVLDRCVEIVENPHKSTASVYIGQYTSLVKHIGGNAVAEETNKSILRELLSSRESIRTTRDISEVWEQRKNLIPKLVFEMLVQRQGMKSYPGEAGVLVFRDLPGANSHGYTVAYDEEGSVGYLADSEQGLSHTAKLRAVLETIDFGSDFGAAQVNQWWVWRSLDGTEISEPLEALTDRVYKIMEKLQDADRRGNRKK